MKIAFVGVKREYQKLPPDYIQAFNRFHLELPWYFARDGHNQVTLTTVDYEEEYGREFNVLSRGGPSGVLRCILEKDFQSQDYDVVVHWRKWFPEFYQEGTINVINCQDHSFSSDWQRSASSAFKAGQLYGILCFPTWHKRNLLDECTWLPENRALAGMTLGVDTDIYKPAPDKDPYQMLWASDLGRGFQGALQLAMQLFQVDRRFRLHVCYPDNSAKIPVPIHPAIIDHRQIPAGPKLFDLFNTCGILPYTSTFKEPSSRAHRQAQAAGSLVLYPPNMGSPSELIEDGQGRIGEGTGVVWPIEGQPNWFGLISSMVKSGEWKQVGLRAREMALRENWAVQAERFTKFFKELRGDA